MDALPVSVRFPFFAHQYPFVDFADTPEFGVVSGAYAYATLGQLYRFRICVP